MHPWNLGICHNLHGPCWSSKAPSHMSEETAPSTAIEAGSFLMGPASCLAVLKSAWLPGWARGCQSIPEGQVQAVAHAAPRPRFRVVWFGHPPLQPCSQRFGALTFACRQVGQDESIWRPHACNCDCAATSIAKMVKTAVKVKIAVEIINDCVHGCHFLAAWFTPFLSGTLRAFCWALPPFRFHAA